MKPPPGYRAESQGNRGLMWGGGLTFGIGYAATLAYGFSKDFEGGLGSTVLPVLGPWLALTKRNFSCDFTAGNDVMDSIDVARACQEHTLGEVRTLAVLTTVGLVQAVGGTLFLVGLFDRQHRWVRGDLGALGLVLDAQPLPGGGMARLGGHF